MTESLCCTVKINIVNQLYVNKNLKKKLTCFFKAKTYKFDQHFKKLRRTFFRHNAIIAHLIYYSIV